VGPTKSGTYATVVGDRIMLTAEGMNVSMDELKAAMGTIELAKAEALAKS
jgi:dTDP-4-amino-4,6-dideoxygalactose transaminase